MEKKLFVFIETYDGIFKVELSKDNFDGNMGNFIARLAREYSEDAVFYVGGLA